MSPVELPAGIEHGTPEGHAAGCKGDRAQCPAGLEHGLSCTVAQVRSVTTPDRYWKAHGRDSRPAAIARTLGLRPERPREVAAPEQAEPEQAEPEAELAPIQDGSATEHVAWSTPAESHKLTAALLSEVPSAAEQIETKIVEFVNDPENRAAVRAWAGQYGVIVATRGRLPQAVVDAYRAQNPELLPAPEIKPTPKSKPKGKRPSKEAVKTRGGGEPARVGPPASEQESPGGTVPATAPVPEPREEESAGLEWSDVKEAFALPEETPAPPERPEWGAVAESVDVERARDTAARLFLELTDAEAARDQALAALEVVLHRWHAARSEATIAQVQVTVARVQVALYRGELEVMELKLAAGEGAMDDVRGQVKALTQRYIEVENERRAAVEERDRLRLLIQAGLNTRRARRLIRGRA